MSARTNAACTRLNCCAAPPEQAIDAPLVQEEPTRAEFDILGTLRRTGRELPPARFAREIFALRPQSPNGRGSWRSARSGHGDPTTATAGSPTSR